MSPHHKSAHRFDVHAHFLPNTYREAAEAAGHGAPDGFPALPKWDAQVFTAAILSLCGLMMIARCKTPGSSALALSLRGTARQTCPVDKRADRSRLRFESNLRERLQPFGLPDTL